MRVTDLFFLLKFEGKSSFIFFFLVVVGVVQVVEVEEAVDLEGEAAVADSEGEVVAAVASGKSTFDIFILSFGDKNRYNKL